MKNFPFSTISYIKRETATFFGVDEESEAAEKQKWLDRRRRMASRKYGALLPEYRPSDPDITKDVPDSTEVSDVSILKYSILGVFILPLFALALGYLRDMCRLFLKFLYIFE